MFSDSDLNEDEGCWQEISMMLETVKFVVKQNRKKKRKRDRQVVRQIRNLKQYLKSTSQIITEEGKLNQMYEAKSREIASLWQKELKELSESAEVLKKKTKEYQQGEKKYVSQKSLEKLNKQYERSSSVISQLHQQQFKESKFVHKKELRKISSSYQEAMEKKDLSRLKICMKVLLSQI